MMTIRLDTMRDDDIYTREAKEFMLRYPNLRVRLPILEQDKCLRFTAQKRGRRVRGKVYRCLAKLPATINREKVAPAHRRRTDTHTNTHN